ncbi:MAG: hypothetical protein LBB98_15095 [Treponema sp.]|jgi:hypothetical protein|nr:hypothetical protein [Treponema sp.]
MRAAAFLTVSVLFSIAPYFITSEVLGCFLGRTALSFLYDKQGGSSV